MEGRPRRSAPAVNEGEFAVSGLLQWLIGLIVFLGIGGAVYRDARSKVSYNILVLFGIVLFSFFGFFTIYEWKFVGF